jgi:hypothetical protein
VRQRIPFSAILMIAAVFMIAGCNDEQRLQGTTAGFQKCFEAGKKQGLQDNGIKVHCSAKHEKSIDVSMEGRASYDSLYTDTAYQFSGTVKNSNTDYVVTGFYVILTRKGGELLESKDFKNVWIEPGGQFEFEINSSELGFKPKGEERNMKNYSWNISGIRGIKILTQ